MMGFLSLSRHSSQKRSVIAATLFCLLLTALALPAGASPAPDKKDKTIGRLLLGKVLDSKDSPIPDAIVYLTNSRTRAVKTYITGPDGTYRFPTLSTAIDYEVYAQSKGKKSDTKSVSQFDDRPQVYLDLKITQ